LFLGTAFALAAPSHAVERITNGDFSDGLNSWTVVATPNGTAGSGLPAVATFDVTGSGATTAAKLEVGRATGSAAGQFGVGLVQNITTVAGPLSFSMDFAAATPLLSFNNEGGVFSVWLNDVQQTSVAIGKIAMNSVIRNSLSFDTVVGAGTQKIEVRVTRPFSAVSGVPTQYITNISALNGAVPEPGTWAMLIIGFGFVGSAVRRRRVAAA